MSVSSAGIHAPLARARPRQARRGSLKLFCLSPPITIIFLLEHLSTSWKLRPRVLFIFPSDFLSLLLGQEQHRNSEISVRQRCRVSNFWSDLSWLRKACFDLSSSGALGKPRETPPTTVIGRELERGELCRVSCTNYCD